MPEPAIHDWDLAGTWATMYGEQDRDPASPTQGERKGYGREFAKLYGDDPYGWRDRDHFPKWRDRRQKLPGVIDNSTGLVVGCGFGFLMEEIADFIAADVWGVDPSTHIHANLASEARADMQSRIIQADIRDPNLTDTFKPLIGGNGKFSWVLTEEVLSCHTDAGIEEILDACEAMLKGGNTGRIIHVVNRTTSKGFNGKTLSEWAAIRPSHTWMLTSGEVAQ